MKISVIIPVYNTEQYLAECLDSVIAQDFGDWECLLINDGSRDGSGAICDAYAQSDSRFRVWHKANSGVSAARNLGIEHATGSYFAFIDSDDTVDTGYLSRLYMAMTDNNADLAVCGMKNIRAGQIVVNVPEEGCFTVDGANSYRFIELNRKSLIYGPWIKLYRSDIIRDKSIRFPVGVNFGEDLIFNFNYLEHATTIATVAAPYYNYRIASEGTLSTSRYSRDFDNNYNQWRVIRSFFERRGISGTLAREFLSDRLWGIAYDTAMSAKLSLQQIRNAFSTGFTDDLQAFGSYTIEVPRWLEAAISNRWHFLIWLIQHRVR